MARRLHGSGHLHVLLANVLLQLLGFGSVLLVAKFLRPDELALIKTAQAYAAVVVILAGAGLTTPVLFYGADPKIADDEKRSLLRAAIGRLLLVSAGVVASAFLLVHQLVGLGTMAGKVYALYALTLPALALTSLLFVYLQARQQFELLAKSQALIKSASIGVVIAATYSFGLTGFLIATIATVYVGLLPLLYQALSGGRSPYFVLPPDFYSRAAYGGVGTFITMLGQSSDFMVMDFTNVAAEAVGRYALASVFLLAAVTLTGSIQTVITPRFTGLLDDKAAFHDLLAAWSRRMPFVSVSIALAGVTVAYGLERLFFDPAYSGFTGYLVILMLKYILWSNYAVVGAAMAGAGIVRSGVMVAAVTTVLSFAIGLPMCRAFGAAGAAWSQAIVAAFTLVAILFVQRAEFRRLFG